MRSIPEEVTALISDLEHYLGDGLKGESLSKKAKERREAFIKRIKEVKIGYACFLFLCVLDGDDSDDDEEVDSNNDGGSLQSERTDKDEEACEGTSHRPLSRYVGFPFADHSFFGTEWQRRWCALSHHIFYYYGSEKDKQQKGEFNIDGYTVKMNNTLRKDSKKDCCFEVSAPDKRVYQFCASSAREAEEWVKQIDFVLKDMSGIIPEEEEEVQEVYDDVGQIDDDIYEELPGTTTYYIFLFPSIDHEEIPKHCTHLKHSTSFVTFLHSVDKSTDYPNYYQGLWDCTGDFSDELSFKRGDAIYILSKEYQNFGWWVGEKNGNIGIVPKDYLTELYVL
uniref:Src kinase associated phosphoprotein 2 n=1 Tax=Mola mola TaxID=94237 RepID=A0A3Q3W0V8_MOLML